MKVDIGSAYYPEDWDNERIEVDAQLMEKAGVSIVRIGEFAWSHMEPEDGVYTFQWLHDACRILEKHHVNIIMCTPTSTAPAWLCKKHPEIMRIHPDGSPAVFGVRDHTCYNSTVYRAYAVRIASKMAAELKKHRNIIAWQLDNEPGHSSNSNCHCPECQSAFRSYLKKKYGTVQKLNKAWGTVFWSQEYSAWDEVKLGYIGQKFDSTRVLDSLIFWSNAAQDFLTVQADAIRSQDPKAFIGTNNISGLIDRARLAAKLDFTGADFYPQTGISVAHASSYLDLYRGLRPGHAPWILESSTCPGAPAQNLFRFYLWSFIARGAEKVCYFHWRSHLGGYEKTHGTFLGYSGKPRERYQVLADSIREVNQVLKPYNLPLLVMDAAVIFDYENHWNFCQGFWQKWIDYEQMNGLAHEVLLSNGINSDIICADADFSRYKLIVFPQHSHFTKAVAEKLKKFTAEGGVVVLGGESGIFDGNSKYIPEPGPEHVTDLFGITIEDYLPLGNSEMLNAFEPRENHDKGDVIVSGKLGTCKVTGQVSNFMMDVELAGARALMTFSNSVYQGKPYCTINKYGKGYAIYYASTFLDKTALSAILRFAAEQAKISHPVLPPSVECVTRGPLTFILNHSDAPVSFQLDVRGKNVLGKFFSKGEVNLPAREVCIIGK